MGTVTNVAPWLFSVAASTIDRNFVSYLQLGDKKHIIMGASLSTGLPYEKFYSLISSVDAKVGNATIEDAKICKVGSLDPNKVKGKILFCLVRELDGLVYAEEEAISGEYVHSYMKATNLISVHQVWTFFMLTLEP